MLLLILPREHRHKHEIPKFFLVYIAVFVLGYAQHFLQAFFAYGYHHNAAGL